LFFYSITLGQVSSFSFTLQNTATSKTANSILFNSATHISVCSKRRYYQLLHHTYQQIHVRTNIHAYTRARGFQCECGEFVWGSLNWIVKNWYRNIFGGSTRLTYLIYVCNEAIMYSRLKIMLLRLHGLVIRGSQKETDEKETA